MFLNAIPPQVHADLFVLGEDDASDRKDKKVQR
jgi:hypothetical protein